MATAPKLKIGPSGPVMDTSSPQKIIYADRIAEFALGASVSRITFALETGPNALSPVITIALPTFGLIEALDYMLTTIRKDTSFIPQVEKSLAALKSKMGEQS